MADETAGKRYLAHADYRGQTFRLREPLADVRCWNFVDSTKYEIPAGYQFRIDSAEGTDSTVICLVDGDGRACGIELQYAGRPMKGYRFTALNTELNRCAGTNLAPKQRDMVGDILRFESGEMDEEEVREFLTYLRDSGVLHSLQGSYGRAAASLGIV